MVGPGQVGDGRDPAAAGRQMPRWPRDGLRSEPGTSDNDQPQRCSGHGCRLFSDTARRKRGHNAVRLGCSVHLGIWDKLASQAFIAKTNEMSKSRSVPSEQVDIHAVAVALLLIEAFIKCLKKKTPLARWKSHDHRRREVPLFIQDRATWTEWCREVRCSSASFRE